MYCIKKILILTITLAIACQIGMAQETRKYSNEFLSLGIGGRALAMGNVQGAIADDVTAAYWNPAGLNNLSTFQLAYMHAEWFAGIAKYDYAGFALPIADRKRTIGLSVIRFGVDDIPNTLRIIEPDGSVNYDNITTFSAADYAFLLSYAQNIKKVRIGANAKLIHRVVGSFAKSWGLGLDIGAQFDLSSRFKMGIAIKDFPATFNTWGFSFTDEEKQLLNLAGQVIPVNSTELTGQRTIISTAYNQPIGKKMNLLAALDLDITTDGKRNTLVKTDFMSIDPHLGLELDYAKTVFLRAGFNNIQQYADSNGKNTTSIQPNVGAGFRLRDNKKHRIPEVKIDYAFTGLNRSGEGLYSHVISLVIALEKKKTQQAEIQKTNP